MDYSRFPQGTVVRAAKRLRFPELTIEPGELLYVDTCVPNTGLFCVTRDYAHVSIVGDVPDSALQRYMAPFQFGLVTEAWLRAIPACADGIMWFLAHYEPCRVVVVHSLVRDLVVHRPWEQGRPAGGQSWLEWLEHNVHVHPLPVTAKTEEVKVEGEDGIVRKPPKNEKNLSGMSDMRDAVVQMTALFGRSLRQGDLLLYKDDADPRPVYLIDFECNPCTQWKMLLRTAVLPELAPIGYTPMEKFRLVSDNDPAWCTSMVVEARNMECRIAGAMSPTVWRALRLQAKRSCNGIEQAIDGGNGRMVWVNLQNSDAVECASNCFRLKPGFDPMSSGRRVVLKTYVDASGLTVVDWRGQAWNVRTMISANGAYIEEFEMASPGKMLIETISAPE